MKEKEKKVKYPVTEFAQRGTLILPDHIFTQINILHNRVGKKEWSGLLLYEVISGGPSKASDFVLKARHIFLMDIGNSGFTEYETDSDIVDLYDNIEGAMDMKIGHIHTHHDMSAFFSATDTDELQENVDKHNYYLSLIVNFSGEYKAKVAFISDVHTHSKMSFIDDNGKKSHFKTDTIGKNMVTIDMDIVYDYDEDFFYNRYTQVVEKMKKKAERKPKWGSDSSWNKVDNGVLELPFGKPIDSDPKDMKNHEVERLTRNVLSFSVNLKEARSCYQILHAIADSKEEEKGLYYQYFAENVGEVILNFFDQELEVDEMKIVIKEIRDSIMRFYYAVRLKSLIDNIDLILEEYMIAYENIKVEEEIDEAIEKEKDELSEEIEKLEEELL